MITNQELKNLDRARHPNGPVKPPEQSEFMIVAVVTRMPHSKRECKQLGLVYGGDAEVFTVSEITKGWSVGEAKPRLMAAIVERVKALPWDSDRTRKCPMVRINLKVNGQFLGTPDISLV